MYARDFSVRDYVIGSVSGAVGAAVFATLFNLHGAGPEIDSAKMYHQQTRPKIMCVERNKRHQIMVEDGDDNYIRLEDHLDKVPQRYNHREKEKERILELVGWNKDKKRCER